MARYYLLLLLILVSRVACNDHSSAQPRGPDLGDPAGISSNHGIQPVEGGQAAGECPAGDEQVY